MRLNSRFMKKKNIHESSSATIYRKPRQMDFLPLSYTETDVYCTCGAVETIAIVTSVTLTGEGSRCVDAEGILMTLRRLTLIYV